MKFIKTIKDTVSSSKLFGALLIAGFSLTSFSVAIAQDTDPDELLNVICLEHKRKTIITYNSDDDVWCAMGNQRDCSKKRGLATSRACAYSARKAKPFLEQTEATSNTTAVTSENNKVENLSASSPETASATTSSTNAPAASLRQEQLQDELLALQERLVALRVKQLELRKREVELRKRLSNTDGGVRFN